MDKLILLEKLSTIKLQKYKSRFPNCVLENETLYDLGERVELWYDENRSLYVRAPPAKQGGAEIIDIYLY